MRGTPECPPQSAEAATIAAREGERAAVTHAVDDEPGDDRPENAGDIADGVLDADPGPRCSRSREHLRDCIEIERNGTAPRRRCTAAAQSSARRAAKASPKIGDAATQVTADHHRAGKPRLRAAGTESTGPRDARRSSAADRLDGVAERREQRHFADRKPALTGSGTAAARRAGNRSNNCRARGRSTSTTAAICRSAARTGNRRLRARRCAPWQRRGPAVCHGSSHSSVSDAEQRRRSRASRTRQGSARRQRSNRRAERQPVATAALAMPRRSAGTCLAMIFERPGKEMLSPMPSMIRNRSSEGSRRQIPSASVLADHSRMPSAISR